MLKSSSPFGKREETVPHSILSNAATSQSAARPAPVSSAPAQASADKDLGAGNRLIVGPDVRLKGAEILDCDTLVVEGHVEATMDSRIIRIAEKGEFTGKVGIDIAEIRGTFTGELNVRDQLIIHSTGKVNGTVRYGKVLIEEGGQLCGDIQMLNKSETVKPALQAPRIAQS
jgi:cytoskeletal protein CcmA (bactofilin family)